MTHNQINARNARAAERQAAASERQAGVAERNATTKEGELVETKRNNRYRNAIDTANAITGGIKNVGGALTSVIGKSNDPSWYNLDPAIVKDVARIPFGAPLGSLKTRMYRGTTVPREPGIMHLWFAPCLCAGDGPSESAAINVAAKNIYAYVRHENSGATNYEAVDMQMFLISMASALSMLSWGQRLYSLLREAKAEDRYYPQAYIYAFTQGDAQATADWFEHINDLRATINQVAIRLSAFNIPAILPLFKRWVWLSGTIFKDAPVKKSQQYLFSPEIYYVWNDEAGSAVATSAKPAFTSYSNYVAAMTTIVNSFITSEDFGIISGDMLKAYGYESMVKVNSIDDDYHVESVYSDEVLSQISNAKIAGAPALSVNGNNPWSLVQSNNGLIYQGTLATGYAPVTVMPTIAATTSATTYTIDQSNGPNFNYSYLNMYKDDASPDDVMVATRLTATLSPILTGTGSNYFYAQVSSAGTEIVTTVDLVYLNTTGQPTISTVASSYLVIQATLAVGGEDILNETVSINWRMLEKFDWAPYVSVIAERINTTTNTIDQYYKWDNVEVQNYYYIEQQELTAMHAVAQLSLFGVPLVGSKSKSYQNRR